jgi:hypothetical protein
VQVVSDWRNGPQLNFEPPLCSVKGAEKPFSGTNPACEASIAHLRGLCNSFTCAAATKVVTATMGAMTRMGVKS